jgi:GH15 family glucan-1,4-alpha-glucosidase
MTLSALFELGHVAETEQYLAWIEKVTSRGVRGKLSIVYRLQEPVPPDDETALNHLSGYKNSRPVRIGQYVIHQRQHDIYGELLDALFAVSRLVGKIRFEDWKVLQPLVDEVIRVWREPDDGIREARIGPRHYAHSKLMCWAALDCAIEIAEHYGFAGVLTRRAKRSERGSGRRRGAHLYQCDEPPRRR